MVRLNQDTEALDGLDQKEPGENDEGEDEKRHVLGCRKDLGVSTG